MTYEQLDAAMAAIRKHSTQFEKMAQKHVDKRVPEVAIAYNQLTLVCHVLHSALKAAQEVTPK